MTHYYSNSNLQIYVGDYVDVDGRRGTVKLICEPGSQDSVDYSCSDTGGLLIEDDEYGLTLIPWDMFDEINRASASE